jgi:hypothetical protein
MAEPNPSREHSGELNPPVPEATPMPPVGGRNVGVAATAIASVLALLALVVADTAGGLDGWWRLLYVIPAATFAAAGLVLVREAVHSGPR